jgi:hypothetical protein
MLHIQIKKENMKLLKISLLIFLPNALWSQVANKFEIADSIIDVKAIMKANFGDEMIQQMDALASMGGLYSMGILELNNIVDEKEEKMGKHPGACQCHIMMGKLEIANAIGFMAGIASVIEVNLADSTYQSKIYFNTDGMKTHKFKPEDEFIQDIEVLLVNSRLEFSPDSKFEHNGIFKGRLIGTSVKYYEQDNSAKGYKEVQTKVHSIFECKLMDFEQMMIDNGMEGELEKVKTEMEKEKKKKN